jgi:hypothetical protein
MLKTLFADAELTLDSGIEDLVVVEICVGELERLGAGKVDELKRAE